MRPDLEDYEELNTTDEAPRSRAMSWIVLTVAVAGFAALAYYAYHSGTSGSENGDVLVVQADEAPIKDVPADKGGEDFANKDKTIYDVITPGSTANSNQAKVEKLLPDPEQPVAVHEMGDEDSTNNPESAKSASGTTTFVNKSLEKTPAVDPVDTQAAKQPTLKPAPQVVQLNQPSPTVTKIPAAAAPTQTVTSAPVATPAATPTPTPAAKPIVTTAAAPTPASPTFVNESTVAGKATPVAETKKTVAKAPAKEVKKEAPKEAVKKPAATGGNTVQLGAFKSEEEAQTTWKKIQGKFASILTGSPTIVKADLPNGTFYRLRTNVSSAKDACATLSAKGQACFSVK